MENDQLETKLEWIDDQRIKDRRVLATLEEQVASALTASSTALPRLEKLETDLVEFRAALTGRLDKLEELLSPLAGEIARINAAAARQAETAREAERLLQVEQQGLSRAVGELRKSTELVPRLMEDVTARKDEELRLNRALAALESRVEQALQAMDERERTMVSVQENYRKDSKRLTEFQTDVTDVRRRVDEHNGKLAVLEDIAGRTDTRVSELIALETERRLSQSTWIEEQTIAQAERDRSWKEFSSEIESFRERTASWSNDMQAYDETHRAMRRTLDSFHDNLEGINRRIGEIMEVQRLTEERFRQDWNAFLADDQKKWTTHMLLRDEQWRDNERKLGKHNDRLSIAEADLADLEELFREKQFAEQSRLQSLYNLIREALAEYDETLTKVR